MTWLDILGEICNLLCVFEAHLLVAGFVQDNVVGHAHEDDPVWKFFRRRIPRCFRDELLNPTQYVHNCVPG